MKKAYIETYGCQMNQADSEVVASILKRDNYEMTTDIAEADLILVNTCSIRENAEQRVKKRLTEFDYLKRKKTWLRVGVLGCMAERLQNQLIEENKVDIVVGPDSYRDIPFLLNEVEKNKQSYISAMLSEEEAPEWGSVEERGIGMEITTAAASLTSGSDMVIMKHPAAIATIAKFIDSLM